MYALRGGRDAARLIPAETVAGCGRDYSLPLIDTRLLQCAFYALSGVHRL